MSRRARRPVTEETRARVAAALRASPRQATATPEAMSTGVLPPTAAVVGPTGTRPPTIRTPAEEAEETAGPAARVATAGPQVLRPVATGGSRWRPPRPGSSWEA